VTGSGGLRAVRVRRDVPSWIDERDTGLAVPAGCARGVESLQTLDPAGAIPERAVAVARTGWGR
jgi:hypothetical protein